MRNLIRRTTVLVGATALMLGSGIGAAAAAPPQRSVAFEPSSHDYGTLAFGESASWVFTVTNTGGRGTGRLDFTLEGDTTEFSIFHLRPNQGGCRGGLGRGRSCTLGVAFHPNVEGQANVTLSAVDNKGELLGSATLTGTGKPPVPCVKNTSTGVKYHRLQLAVDDAHAGDTLSVFGTCDGTTFVDKELTITGKTGATLNGLGHGSVLVIRHGADVRLDTLTITNGAAVFGGGIDNSGALTLDGSTITGNTAFIAGGIDNGGTVTLKESKVTGNGADDSGGGIFNFGTVTLDGSSSVSGNRLPVGPAGRHVAGPRDGLHVSCGGGIYNSDGGTVIMNGSSSVRGNTAGIAAFEFPGCGGGIYNRGTVTMNDKSTITGNTAVQADGHGGHGGGIFNIDTATTSGAECGVNVLDNHPDNIFPTCP